MLRHVLHAYGMNLGFAKMLVNDLSTDQMCQQPHGVINHPAWSLGHLAVSEGRLCKLLGVESPVPEGWEKTFRTGGTPSAKTGSYPSRDELVSVLAELHERVGKAVSAADQETLERAHPDEGARSYFPTVGDMALFLMTSHEMDHLGQIAAWRRAMGLGPAR